MVSVVIPAYNESDRIGATIDALIGHKRSDSSNTESADHNTGDIIDEIIVVDDGSTDDTAAVARKAGAMVITLSQNSGKGAAMNAGIKSASGDILLLLDADLGSTAAESLALLKPVMEGAADLAIATFPVIPGKGGGFGFVVNLARNGIRDCTGKEMLAPLSGQRAIRRTVLEKVGDIAPGFGAEVALTIDALCAGFRVVEIPTQMTHRVTGRDWRAIMHRLKQYLAVRSALSSRRNRRC